MRNINIMPDKWLYKIKELHPKFCLAELVMWNMGYRGLLEILRPEENGMLIGACHAEVERVGHGWCGSCTSTPIEMIIKELRGDFTHMLHVDGEYNYIDELEAIISRYTSLHTTTDEGKKGGE